MATLTRRSSRRDDEEERDERPTRGRRRDEDPDEEREARPRRRTSSRKNEDPADERPSRTRRSRSRDDSGEEEEERPRRSRRGEGSRGERAGRRGTSGFASYNQKKRSSGDFADDFKPKPNHKYLIKMGDAEPFDSINQHFVKDRQYPNGKTYVCFDDEYFADDKHYEDGCPLCDIGESARTLGLWNIINLDNPRKPQVQVWATPPSVTEQFERLAEEKKTSPLNREDLYFEIEQVKTPNKTTYTIIPVKARDLPEDFDMDPLDAEELEDFEKDFFDDRTSVTKVTSWEDLDDLAESLD